MKKESLTPMFILLIVVLIAVYDFWVIMTHTNYESISAHILSMGEVTPFIPCLLGFTFGHLTWPNKKSFIHEMEKNYFSYSFFALTTIPALYDVFQLYVFKGELIISNYNLGSTVPFVTCYVLGHFLWPLDPSKWSGRFKK